MDSTVTRYATLEAPEPIRVTSRRYLFIARNNIVTVICRASGAQATFTCASRAKSHDSNSITSYSRSKLLPDLDASRGMSIRLLRGAPLLAAFGEIGHNSSVLTRLRQAAIRAARPPANPPEA